MYIDSILRSLHCHVSVQRTSRTDNLIAPAGWFREMGLSSWAQCSGSSTSLDNSAVGGRAAEYRVPVCHSWRSACWPVLYLLYCTCAVSATASEYMLSTLKYPDAQQTVKREVIAYYCVLCLAP